MTDTLHEEPARDHFKSESPIRAFTTWIVQGDFAIGKGFRPSLAHLVTYLDAMQRKEGWQIVQILEAGSQTPSMLFRCVRQPTDDELRARHPTLEVDLDSVPVFQFLNPYDCRKISTGLRLVASNIASEVNHSTWPNARKNRLLALVDRINGYAAELAPGEPIPLMRKRAPTKDDPVNPKHYGGTGCAEIIENMPGNCAHAVTYLWRAGDKPDQPEVQEAEKALWFLKRELVLAREYEEGEDNLLPGQVSAMTWRLPSPKRKRNEDEKPNRFYDFAAERIPETMPLWRKSAITDIVRYVVGHDEDALIRAADTVAKRIVCLKNNDCPEFGRQQEP